jgi:hypothetical protein
MEHAAAQFAESNQYGPLRSSLANPAKHAGDDAPTPFSNDRESISIFQSGRSFLRRIPKEDCRQPRSVSALSPGPARFSTFVLVNLDMA